MARSTTTHRHTHDCSGPLGLLAGLTMIAGRGPSARLVADLAAVGPADHVVDVGCGPGAAAREAARRGARVTAVDPSPQMLRLARLLTRGDRRRSVELVAASAEDLTLPDGTASVVWALASAHHWHDVAAGLREAHRVLAPAGRLLVVERLTRPRGLFAHHALTHEGAGTLARAVADAGFVDVAVDEHRAGRRHLVVVRGRRA
ncbi:MAG TPA: class I SAM-dependent methyltransferase [Acidimicrobiia bacterium]